MNMYKTLLLLFFVTFSGASCTGVARSNGVDPQALGDASWHALSRSSLADVFVERALYERDQDPHFYMQVRIDNASTKAIYVDLDDYGTVYHPNQWGVLNTSQRMMINERRLVQPGLDAARRQAIHKAFKAGGFTEIAPGSSITYFRDFNNRKPGRFEIYEDRAEGKQWLFVSLDGYLVLTDGQVIEQTGQSQADKAIHLSEVIFDAPLVWKQLPHDAFIIEDD